MMEPVSLILIIFSIIGIFDAMYISFHATTGKLVKCWFFPKSWCKKVQYSKYSKMFGIPNGYLGLLLYAAIFLFTLFNLYTSMPFWPVIALSVFGFAFSLYFLFIQAVVLRAFCIYCIVSAINLTVIFIAVMSKVL